MICEEKKSRHNELWDSKISEIITDVDLDICKIGGLRHFLFILSGELNCLVSLLVLNIWCTHSLLNHTWKMDWTYTMFKLIFE